MADVAGTDRLVEVHATFSKRATRYATGFLVDARTVLTAAHVVLEEHELAREVTVRVFDATEYTARIDPAFVGDPRIVDLALLEIQNDHSLQSHAIARIDRNVPGFSTVSGCRAAGFPSFNKEEGKRDIEQVDGEIPIASKALSGLLTLETRKLPAGDWGGMSGGPVLAGEFLIGVVSSQNPREGVSSLTVTPLTSLEKLTNRADWWRKLGVADPGRLPSVPPAGSSAGSEPASVQAYRRALSLARQNLDRVFDDVDVSRFTGRVWLTSQVDAFISDHDRGYIWLEAEAGLGKTTYAAYLASERRYAAHFSRRRGTALENLAAQLIERHQLDISAFETAQTTDGFYDLLVQAVDQADCPVVIVLDGLDEARAEAGPLLGLPDELPPGAYVIGTYRIGSRPVLPYFRHTKSLSIKSRDDRNRTDVMEHLAAAVGEEKISEQLALQRVSPERFGDELARKVDGVWIYLRYVLDDLRQGLRTVREIHELPPDLLGYYVDSIQRWQHEPDGRPHPDWGASRLPILATLAVAAEPLDVDTLAALSAVSDQDKVRELCNKLFRAFLSVEDPAGARRFAVYHAGFREFLCGKLPAPRDGEHDDTLLELADTLKRATRNAHSRLADQHLHEFGGLDEGLPRLAARLSGGELPRNHPGLRLGWHLGQAGRIEDLERLLACEYIPAGSSRPANLWHAANEHAHTWDAYVTDLERAYRATASEVDQGLRGGTGTHRLGSEVRYALLSASMRSLTSTTNPLLVEDLLETGAWDAGRAAAQARATQDPVDRARSTALLLVHLDPERQADLVAGALAAARGSTDVAKQVRALAILAPYLAAGERAATLRGTLDTIEDARTTDRVRAELIECLAPHLDHDGLRVAAAMAERLSETEDRAVARVALVPYVPSGQRREVVQRIVEVLGDVPDYKRPGMLARLAPYLEPGQVRDAWAATEAAGESARGRYGTPATLEALVPYLAGDERADATDRIDADRLSPNRDVKLARILSSLASMLSPDQFRGAVADAHRIDSTRRHAEFVRVRQVEAGAEIGDSVRLPMDRLRAALGAAEAVDGIGHDNEALSALARCLPPDQLGGALLAACLIPDEQVRLQALWALLPFLDDEQLIRALRQVLAVGDPLGGRHRPLCVLELAALAQRLPTDQFRAAVHSYRSSRDLRPRLRAEPEDRWFTERAPAPVAPQGGVDLPVNLSPDQLRAALAAVEVLATGSVDHSGTLAAWARNLEPEQLRAAARAASAIADEHLRISALVSLFPYLDDEALSQALADVLAVSARSGRDRQVPMVLMLSLATHLRPEQLREATALARARMADRSSRAAVEPWDGIPGSPELLSVARTGLVIQDRVEVAKALTALALCTTGTSRAPAVETALQAACNLEADDRARALAGLAPGMGPDQLRRTAALISDQLRNPSDGIGRFAAVSELAPLLPEDLREQVLDLAFAAARGLRFRAIGDAFGALAPQLRAEQLRTAVADSLRVADPGWRMEALAALAEHLPGDAVREAFAAVRALNGKVEALLNRALQLPPALADDLAALALGTVPDDHAERVIEAVPAELRGEVVDSLAAAGAVQQGAAELAPLVLRLPGSERERVKSHLLDAMPTYFGSLVLAELAPILDAGELDDTVSHLHNAEQQVRVLTALGRSRPGLLSRAELSSLTTDAARSAAPESVAELVPYLSAEQRIVVSSRAERALEGGRDYAAAVLLCAVFPHVPRDQRSAVLTKALAAIPAAYDNYRQLGLHGVSAALLRRAGTLSHAAATPEEKLAVDTFWRDLIRNRPRDECLDIVAAMAPWVAARGGHAAVEECFAAVVDISRWWQ